MVRLLVVRDGLDDVLPPRRHGLVVPLHLGLVLHRRGGEAQLRGPPVHARVLLLATEIKIIFEIKT